MGYFDGLVESTLKKDKSGNTVFYPWGVLGKGRVIADADREIQLRRFLLRYYKVTLPVSIIFGILRIWPLLPIIVGVFTAWYLIESRRVLAGTPFSEERLTLKEGYRNSAMKHNKFTLWVLFLFCLLFVVAGIAIALKGVGQSPVIFGLGCAIFFGLCSLAIGYMLRAKYVA